MLVQVGIQNRAGVGGQLRAGQQVTSTQLVCSVFLVKVNLECESHGGNPLASLHWSKDGVETDTGFNVDCSIVLWDSCLYFVVQSYRERERSVNLLPLTLSQVLPHSVLLRVSWPGVSLAEPVCRRTMGRSTAARPPAPPWPTLSPPASPSRSDMGIKKLGNIGPGAVPPQEGDDHGPRHGEGEQHGEPGLQVSPLQPRLQPPVGCGRQGSAGRQCYQG